jgi:hypothetical protein
LSVGKLRLGVKEKGLSKRNAGVCLGSGVDFWNQRRYDQKNWIQDLSKMVLQNMSRWLS